jgi:hypothetical protein
VQGRSQKLPKVANSTSYRVAVGVGMIAARMSIVTGRRGRNNNYFNRTAERRRSGTPLIQHRRLKLFKNTIFGGVSIGADRGPA